MRRLLLKNVNVIDGTENMVLQENMDILTEDGKIKKIGKNIEDTSTKVIDLTGKYVMPGMINLHVHMPGDGKLTKKKVADKSGLVSFILKNKLNKSIGISLCAKYAKEELYSGVTTIRAVGGLGDIDAILRDKIKSGKKPGPRMIVANNAIGIEHCHMYGTVAVGAKDNEEAVKLTDKQIDTGADIIKIMITGGILDTKERGKPGVLKIEPSMVKAICDEAHKRGVKVAAHVEGPEGMEVAILNGVDTIEHGAIVSDELLLKHKERGGAVVLTLSPAIPLAVLNEDVTGYSETVQYNTKVFMKWMIDNADRCIELGIPVGLGTDTACPMVSHYNFWRELVYYTKNIKNATNSEAIYRGTLGNARIAGIDNITGSIEEGKLAELLITEKNPLEDLRNLKEPLMVLFNNKVYKKKNKKMKKMENLLDTLI